MVDICLVQIIYEHISTITIMNHMVIWHETLHDQNVLVSMTHPHFLVGFSPWTAPGPWMVRNNGGSITGGTLKWMVYSGKSHSNG